MEFRVCELFAGVGGFHLGLKKAGWEVIWANQWEPGKKEQHAAKCYSEHFGDTVLANEDIAKVKKEVPDHDLLVGGFPCQDYSVASSMARGLHGKKGVLWWEIYDIVKKKKPPHILLENVDRLLRSPVGQRGRDFGIILACFKQLGYTVEWRVINAAEYGFYQRRRRVFIFATKDKKVIDELYSKDPDEIIDEKGLFAPVFPISRYDHTNEFSFKSIKSDNDIKKLSDGFECDFYNAGVLINGQMYTKRVHPEKSFINKGKLKKVLDSNVLEEYYISKKDVYKKSSGKKSWEYCKGAKNEPRKNGKPNYKEGAIPFPDNLEMPSRTILTSEGSMRPNRSGHLVKDPETNKFRIITPEECEKLNGFSKGWTKSLPKRWRYFCMGNALVVGLIEIMGKRLKSLVGDNPYSNIKMM